MTTLLDRQHTALLKKFHTLLGKLGIDNDAKQDMLWQSYGVTSAKALNAYELMELCNKLDLQANPKLAEMDKLRKQLMASIGGWLRAMGKESTAELIKGIACRASECDKFNNIPKEQLRSLYSAFKKKQKDLDKVTELTAETLLTAYSNN
jgi:hypothetical protein